MQFLAEPTKFESIQIHLSDVSTAVFVVVAKVNLSNFSQFFSHCSSQQYTQSINSDLGLTSPLRT